MRLDAQLSQRTIQLDPNGYVLIKLDREKGELIVEWFSKGINEQGLATNPETGEVLACKGSAPREPIKRFKGRSAKELGVALTETNEQPFISKLDSLSLTLSSNSGHSHTLSQSSSHSISHFTHKQSPTFLICQKPSRRWIYDAQRANNNFEKQNYFSTGVQTLILD